MVEPSAEELQRWEGTWRPIAFARRREAWVGGVAPRAPFTWRRVQSSVMVEDESLPGGCAGDAAHCADRVTSGGEGAIAVAEAGSSSHVERSMSESGRAGPGVVDAAGEEDFGHLPVEGFKCLPEAIRLEDVRIATASEAFDASMGNEGHFFDFRDGSQVERSEYLRKS